MLSAYHLGELLHTDGCVQVHRARRKADSVPVVLKILSLAQAAPERLARFRHEYELLRKLEMPGLIQAYALESKGEQWIMVLEDYGGLALDRLRLAGSLSLAGFLELALAVVEILEPLHAEHVVHGQINPAHLLYNPATRQVKLAGFGLAGGPPGPWARAFGPSLPAEADLAYISPEQTGRMHREVDYRTDFYSLGMTLYELLTGRLPFHADSPVGWLHHHLATPPPPAQQIDPGVPPAVDAILQKLLAKAAEDRYQSAHGLRADMQTCLDAWRARGEIAPFVLGGQDQPTHLQLPERLYGRGREWEHVLGGLQQAAQGGRELLLLEGYTGVGKTTLARACEQAALQQGGRFAGGKFEQYQRDVPYQALLQACDELLGHMLSVGEQELAEWRAALQAALGNNAGIMLAVLPRLRLVLQETPPVPAASPLEAQNRFFLVFASFLQTLARPGQPLVLFLDDLQWADSASLKLLEALLTAPELHHLLLLGAYRDHEVDARHPLRLTLESLRQAGVQAKHVPLGPLHLLEVNRLLADTFHCAPEDTQDLAALVHAKTGGNPFFIKEFIKTLYSERLLWLIPPQFRQAGEPPWQWDVPRIEAQALTDNLGELMSGKLQKLSAATQEVLRLAACLGNPFDLGGLGALYRQSPRDTLLALQEALRQGLVVPFLNGGRHGGGTYRFAHDRIQQAAYGLIPEESKAELHRQAGLLLLRQYPPEVTDARLFDIVKHLNLAAPLLQDPSARRELAALNLRAGRKAKAAAAYEAAFRYFRAGLDMLEASTWESDYALSLDLHVEAAEAAYLSTAFDEMERLVRCVLRKARGPLDQVAAYEIKILALGAQNHLRAAVETGLEVLALLGVRFPERRRRWQVLWALLKIKLALLGKTPDALLRLPDMRDPEKLAAMRVMAQIGSATYFVAPLLMPLVLCRMLHLTLRFGNSGMAAHAYGGYAMVLAGALGDIDNGYRYAQLALALCQRPDSRQIRSRVISTMYSAALHWKEPLRDALRPLQETQRAALEDGNLEYAARALRIQGVHLYVMGRELKGLAEELAQNSRYMARIKQQSVLLLNDIVRQGVANLVEETPEPWRLDGGIYAESESLPRHLADKDAGALFLVHFFKLHLAYVFGEYALAAEQAPLAARYTAGMTGSPLILCFHFYATLAYLAACPATDGAPRKARLRAARRNLAKLKKWAGAAPVNYRAKYCLAQAEYLRVTQPGKAAAMSRAAELYEEALRLAKQQDCLADSALGYELAAGFYVAQARSELGMFYLQRAKAHYLAWGAAAKVAALEQRHPALRQAAQPARQGLESVDLVSVFTAFQALSSEIELPALLEKLMHTALRNAGAERGMLFMEQGGEWYLQALAHGAEMPVDTAPRPLAPRELPLGLVQYVARTHEHMVLEDASRSGRFTREAYIQAGRVRSVLCLPLAYQGAISGILYLENNLTGGAFTPRHLETLQILSAQMAVALENAKLYASTHALNQQLAQKIEEQTRTEIALRESEARFRDLFESSPLPLWEEDYSAVHAYLDKLPVTDIRGYVDAHPEAVRECAARVVIMRANRAFMELLGLGDLAQLQGKLADIFTPASFEVFKDCMVDLWRGSTWFEAETPVVTTQGEVRTVILRRVAVSGYERDFSRLLGSFTDITARKRAEQELRESEERFRVIAETIPVPLVIACAEGGRLLYVNAQTAEYFGERPEDLIGRSILEIYEDPQERDAFLARVRRDGSARNYEMRFNIKQRIYDMAVYTRPIVYNGEQCVLTAAYDITERKHSEAERARITAQLEELNTRLEEKVQARTRELEQQKETAEHANLAKSRFLAAASHDLRQPLYALSLYITALRKSLDDAALLDIVQRAENSLGAMNELFNALLDISKLDAGIVNAEPRVFPLQAIFTQLAQEFSALAQQKGLEFTVPACDLHVRSDPVLVKRILDNLCSNAIRYTARGRVWLSYHPLPESVRIGVHDTGIGIAAEHHRDIFQEFYQLGNPERDRKKGLGLGLAIVARLCELLKYPLELRSAPGEGSCFSFELPLAKPDLVSPQSGETGTAQGRVSVAARILIIDDELAVCNATQTLLELQGYQARGAASVDEALGLLAASAWRPDLVIADYRLPQERTGIEALQAIHAYLKTPVPGIIITGDTSRERLREAQSAGYPLLYKPVAPEYLLQTIHALLRNEA